MYSDEISGWCRNLKPRDDQTVLVAFIRCSDEDLRLARVFPEYMACDTKFGVIKE